jgi:hypothetical protein
MQRRELQPGSILEVGTPIGLAYLQYIGEHEELGDTVWVLPGYFEERPAEWSTLAWARGFYAFYPARAGVKRKLVNVVGSVPLDDRSVPVVLRRAGARSSDGKVLTWMVSNGSREELREELSQDERSLPIAAIWNHEMLLQRLREDWSPKSAV